MDSNNPGPSGLRSLTRNELYTVLTRSNAATFDKKLQFMEAELLKNFADNDQALPDAKQKISLIKHQFKQKWLAANKMKARFEKNNGDWLNGIIYLPIPSEGLSAGRPQKSFMDSSERSKKRKSEEIRSKDLDELAHATQMKLRESSTVDASKVVKNLTKTPRKAKTKALKKSSEKQEKSLQLSPLRALSMFTEAGLTRAQYEIIRATNKSFFPSYSVLQKAKNNATQKNIE